MRNNSPLGRIIGFVVGIFLVVYDAVGVYNGHIDVGRHHRHEIYAATNPQMFWFTVILFAALGLAAIYNSLRGP